MTGAVCTEGDMGPVYENHVAECLWHTGKSSIRMRAMDRSWATVGREPWGCEDTGLAVGTRRWEQTWAGCRGGKRLWQERTAWGHCCPKTCSSCRGHTAGQGHESFLGVGAVMGSADRGLAHSTRLKALVRLLKLILTSFSLIILL